ncbi:PucR family transcriptional regulator [Ureibacillus sp. MALMAid1270]|uniref:PucR family transcriptional regulator n=1 Tax=Ureibacillus sp. MALMAid1270 TaxID=3411629 RepID=UPI003BA57076
MGLNSTLTTECVPNESELERSHFVECYWMNELIQNQLIDELLIRSQLGNEFKTLNNLSYQVCILEMKKIDHEHSAESISDSMGIHFFSIVRSIFEQYSFRCFMTIQDQRLAILAFDLFPTNTKKEQLKKKEKLELISKQIDNVLNNRETRKKFQVYMGISSTYKGLNNTHYCYEEANKAILLKSFFQSSTIFYDDLGTLEILLNLHEKGKLESFVLRYIGPLIEEDRKKNSDLLKTLKIYLDRNGSKQSVADELHIVRQSLYYRLAKIKELLGEDYMCTKNKLALQLAIQAYELLSMEVG